MFPRINERCSVKRFDTIANLCKIQQTRTRRNQQTNRELNWRNILDQILFRENLQQIEIAARSRPRRKRHKCWLQRQSDIAEYFDRAQKSRARVAFCQTIQNQIVRQIPPRL